MFVYSQSYTIGDMNRAGDAAFIKVLSSNPDIFTLLSCMLGGFLSLFLGPYCIIFLCSFFKCEKKLQATEQTDNLFLDFLTPECANKV